MESFLFLLGKEQKNNQNKQKNNQNKQTNKNDVNVQEWHFAQANEIAALGFAGLTNHIMALGFQKKDMKFLLMELNEPVKFWWTLAAHLNISKNIVTEFTIFNF